MYDTCLRCERPLGANDELPHLPVGRRVAFDTTKGRLWVICRRCGQWNLTPIETRWEAVEECERVATVAEARAAGGELGLARTASGLELLRVGGMPDTDIANWRYGRRLRTRQRLFVSAWAVLVLLAVAIAIGATRLSGSPLAGLFLGALMCVVLLRVWAKPLRLWVRVPDGSGGRRLVWPWDLQHVQFDTSERRAAPVLVVPGRRGPLRLRGAAAAEALAVLLPKVNGADCADVPVANVLERVERVEGNAARLENVGRSARRRARRTGRAPEAGPRLRPWEYLVANHFPVWLTDASPENRLALQMTVD